MRRWKATLLGLALSVGLTVLLWSIGFPGFFLFLLFPFFLFPFGRRSRTLPNDPFAGGAAPPVLVCPACGYQAAGEDVRFCPRDGTRLVIEA